MIEQLKTIREALLLRDMKSCEEALAALTQLEAMVGVQEPVHWRAVLDPEQAPQQLKTTMHVVGFREKKVAEGFAAEQIDFYGWRYTIEPLYAAPVAQQPDFADAYQGAMGEVAIWKRRALEAEEVNRRFVAEINGPTHMAAPVDQQPTFDARRALEAIEALLSNIRRDAPSLSGKVMGFAEEVAAALRDKVAQQYAAGDMASAAAQGFRDGVAGTQPLLNEAIDRINDMLKDDDGQAYKEAHKFVDRVAQQPQARPDFTDEWAGYLKDGETPFERFLRERKDVQSALKLYQRALEENERLKAQQPQAEPLGEAPTIAQQKGGV